MKVAVVIAATTVLLFATACSEKHMQSVTPVANDTVGTTVEPQATVCSGYVEMEAVGESRDRQIAVLEARNTALKKAVDTVICAAKVVAGSNSVPANPGVEYDIYDYKTVSQRITSYYNGKGVKVYKCRTTLRVQIQHIAQQVFSKGNANADVNEFVQKIQQYFNQPDNKKTK